MKNTRKRKGNTGPVRLSRARLDELVEEAIVDCYNESEQATGLYTMIEDNLAFPFATTVRLSPLAARRLAWPGESSATPPGGRKSSSASPKRMDRRHCAYRVGSEAYNWS